MARIPGVESVAPVWIALVSNVQVTRGFTPSDSFRENDDRANARTYQIIAFSQERLFATLTTGFAVLALILACIGIYGLMAYDVSRRTNEIGIRIAMGVRTEQILGMVLQETSFMVMTGVATGLGAALLLSNYEKPMLYGLGPNDPCVMGAAAGLLLVVAMLAVWGPARRAASVEDMVSLRHE